MLDRDYENPYIGLYRHHVTAETISGLLCGRYGAPDVFDVRELENHCVSMAHYTVYVLG